MEAFFVLSPSRQRGMAPGGILLTEMVCCAQLLGIVNVPAFIRLIQALDVVYLAHYAKKEKK